MGDRIVLAVPGSSTTGTTAVVDYWPDPAFGTRAQLSCICWEYEFWQVWKVPLAVSASGRLLPSFRSEEHTSELQSLMRISYAVFCLKTNTKHPNSTTTTKLHNNLPQSTQYTPTPDNPTINVTH